MNQVLARLDPEIFDAEPGSPTAARSRAGPDGSRTAVGVIGPAHRFAEHPHIRIHVAPSTVGAYAGLNGPFVSATSEDHRTAVYLDNQVRGQVVSEPGDIAAIRAAWENVRGESLSHWQSVDLITEVAETWT